MANKLVKEKRALIGISIAMIVLGLAALAGGVVLIIFGVQFLIKNDLLPGILMTVGGCILVILALVVAVKGINFLFVGTAVKATNGTIAETNLAKDLGTPAGLKCPKCGATNTPDASECQVCHTPLK